MSATLAALRDDVVRLTSAPGWQAWLRDLLVRLCRVDTTPTPDVAQAAARERQVFEAIRAELAAVGGRLETRGIDPAIARHPHFSQLYYTQTPACPAGLSVDAAYRGRQNLLWCLEGDGQRPQVGRNAAVNAHIDVVKPYFPPSVEGDTVCGRGSCDDKGSLAVMVAAARLLADLRRERGLVPNRHLTFMFVIEEETGGNGSLSLALDRGLRARYDSVLVLECTGNRLHPANRGAVWYRTAVRTATAAKLEAAAGCVLALEDEGARIKVESTHALFPQRPVQTCHGVLQGFGEHPSRINGEVAFQVRGSGLRRATVEALAAEAVAAYVSRYGDKTRVLDPQTGRPKVARHLAVSEATDGLEVRVWGSTGHMGSILENDGAITKMAYIVRALALARGGVCPADLALSVVGDTVAGDLVLEGGQGFIPTHTLEEVMRRVRAAAECGVRDALAWTGRPAAEATVVTTFDKLHNAAYDGDPGSPSMGSGRAAMAALGLWPEGEAVCGWTVSCDARLFAVLNPGMSVLTFGPGLLTHAHSDREQVHLPDLVQAARMLALYALLETGSVAD